MEGRTVLDLLQQESDHIVSFSARIDGMLEGGVPVGKVTEFCGAPGIGKTQMSIQLAIDATLPVVFGGCGGDSIYIDTEGSFVIERAVQVATATVAHIHAVARNNGDKDLIAEADRYTLESILKRIHYHRCHNYIQLIALSNILHCNISSNSNRVCCVVVDSIASPFRRNFKDISLRNRLLCGIAQNFIKLATRFNLAVVLTNQMTTRIQTNRGFSQLVPALGESWAHMCTIRIILYWKEREEGKRMALLYKSPSKPETSVPYQITRDGIRDVIIPQKEETKTQECSNTTSINSSTPGQQKTFTENSRFRPFKRKCPVEM